jgi:CHAT domain-containing protein
MKNGNLYQAFKFAQIEVKKKYPDPYYWGAFVLVGK